jgi:protein-tyrosine phosphatase
MSYDITLVDKGFWRSPRPTKDQLELWKRLYGIASVLNLEGDAPDAVGCEKGMCDQLHIDESYIAMSGVQRPSANALREAVNFIQIEQATNTPVLVHCLHGVDRTGMVCAAYRIVKQGWTVEQAWAEALAKGMHRIYFWWKNSLEELKGGN